MAVTKKPAKRTKKLAKNKKLAATKPLTYPWIKASFDS